MSITLKLLAVSTFALTAVSSTRAATVDFSDPQQAALFQTDRANPGGFTIAGGTLGLAVTAADAAGQTDNFFDFHGISTRPDAPYNGAAGTLASVLLFVPAAWDAAPLTRAGDLWARIDNPAQPDAGLDNYPSIGVYNIGDDRGALVSLFSPTDGGFDGDVSTDDNILDLPQVDIAFDAYNTLALRLTETGVEYLFNGDVVAVNNDAVYALPGTELDQLYLQGYQGSDDYTAVFDDLSVVPEPTSLSLLALGGLALLRRKR